MNWQCKKATLIFCMRCSLYTACRGAHCLWVICLLCVGLSGTRMSAKRISPMPKSRATQLRTTKSPMTKSTKPVAPGTKPAGGAEPEDSNDGTRLVVTVVCSLLVAAIVVLAIVAVVLLVRRSRRQRRMREAQGPVHKPTTRNKPDRSSIKRSSLKPSREEKRDRDQKTASRKPLLPTTSDKKGADVERGEGVLEPPPPGVGKAGPSKIGPPVESGAYRTMGGVASFGKGTAISVKGQPKASMTVKGAAEMEAKGMGPETKGTEPAMKGAATMTPKATVMTKGETAKPVTPTAKVGTTAADTAMAGSTTRAPSGYGLGISKQTPYPLAPPADSKSRTMAKSEGATQAPTQATTTRGATEATTNVSTQATTQATTVPETTAATTQATTQGPGTTAATREVTTEATTPGTAATTPASTSPTSPTTTPGTVAATGKAPTTQATTQGESEATTRGTRGTHPYIVVPSATATGQTRQTVNEMMLTGREQRQPKESPTDRESMASQPQMGQGRVGGAMTPSQGHRHRPASKILVPTRQMGAPSHMPPSRTV